MTQIKRKMIPINEIDTSFELAKDGTTQTLIHRILGAVLKSNRSFEIFKILRYYAEKV